MEDNSAHMEYITYLLRRLGFNVIKANDGESGLELLDGLEIDCAFLDIHLGSGINGIKLMHEIRDKKKYKDIPIISVTAFYNKENKANFITAGFTDLITKPYNFDQLKYTIKNHIYQA